MEEINTVSIVWDIVPRNYSFQRNFNRITSRCNICQLFALPYSDPLRHEPSVRACLDPLLSSPLQALQSNYREETDGLRRSVSASLTAAKLWVFDSTACDSILCCPRTIHTTRAQFCTVCAAISDLVMIQFILLLVREGKIGDPVQHKLATGGQQATDEFHHREPVRGGGVKRPPRRTSADQ
jgi:hypothetical protein